MVWKLEFPIGAQLDVSSVRIWIRYCRDRVAYPGRSVLQAAPFGASFNQLKRLVLVRGHIWNFFSFDRLPRADEFDQLRRRRVGRMVFVCRNPAGSNPGGRRFTGLQMGKTDAHCSNCLFFCARNVYHPLCSDPLLLWSDLACAKWGPAGISYIAIK